MQDVRPGNRYAVKTRGNVLKIVLKKVKDSTGYIRAKLDVNACWERRPVFSTTTTETVTTSKAKTTGNLR